MTPPPQPRLRHIAIAASAGSGKTFQLAHRYIGLLAAGVTPDRICALTFSRKAAGEIFEKIIAYLVEAATDDRQAAAVADRLGQPSPGASVFLGHLRRFLDNLHRLHIGTLDGFMVGILRAFPAELGIAPDFEVMDSDGAAAADLRRDVLQRIFNPQVVEPRARAEFLEAFKQATFGREEKSADQLLDAFICDHRERYQTLPDEAAWAPPASIWPNGSRWLDRPADVAAACDAIAAHATRAGWDATSRQRWDAFLAAARTFNAFSLWSAELQYLFPRLADVADDLFRGRASIKIGRKLLDLDDAVSPAILDVLAHLVATECRTALASTQGLYRVLAQFDRVYDDWSRRSGQLSFTDAQYLLTEANRHSGGLLLSRNPGTPGRLYIDYRLDARLDHWLIDEFQDTSDLQWAAIRNLVDEVVQDDSGRRSFFYVGDVKQAIYGWRGGNPRLFGNILRTYGDRIDTTTLSTSFRSCPPVLDCVNAVFGDLTRTSLSTGVQNRWQSLWEPHRAAGQTAKLPGYAALFDALADGDERPDEHDRHHLAAAIINDLDPVRRQLTVAVLVRSNKQGRAAVDTLRRLCPGLPVVHEGSAPLNDSPVVTLLLALVRFAAHPGDMMAWRHLQLSPLAPDLAALREEGPLPEPLLRQIHERGFLSFIRDWGHRLQARITLDDFGHRRLEDLLAAAGEFDATGERDGGAFLRFVEHFTISESAAGLAVRVMTIHQSKGLGFDVVILPDLQGRQMLTAGALDLVTRRDPRTDRPEWVVKLPRRVVTACDSELSTLMQAADEENNIDELCVLYVALTRAKQALYMITSRAGKDSASYTPAALLKHRLAGHPNPDGGRPDAIANTAFECLYETGRRDWFSTRPVAPPPRLPPPAPSPPPAPRPESHVPAPSDHPTASRSPVEPSAHDAVSRRAAWLFDRESRDVLDFGSAVHALFEQVDWSQTADVAHIVADWERHATVSPAVKRDAVSQFRRCMADLHVQALLARPTGNVDLWREQRFELILTDGRWVRGAFDRVVVQRDNSGRPTQAAIIDYKSDRVSTDAQFRKAADHYHDQLALYARVVAHIAGLPPAQITRTLIFTRAPRIYAYPPAP
ncbi:MAG: UvrD-helicase domain-containing protein [Lentisphaerae bacterium]|nr:UvrD-helicase domain-containing protein [Lentisphaerota bacterium]